MASLATTFLSKSEQDLIHEKSIECLEQVGIRVDSESVLELLEKGGASVDYENYRAKIPAKMVNQALEALRPEQGYPLRLFVPGWEGNISVKWPRPKA